MQIPQPENVSSHFFWIAVPIILSLGLQQYFLHRKGEKEKNVAADKVAEAITKRDDKLMYILKEHTPHSHVEGEGEPLTEPGIRYPKIPFGDGEH